MPKVLFSFIKQVASLAQKYSAAGLLKVSNPKGNEFAGWKHVVLHYLRVHEEMSYEDVTDLASKMDRVRGLLQLPLYGFPAGSTLYSSFNRAPMHVWRALLRRSAALLERSGRGAVDATFFDRNQASSHYLRRIDRSIETLKLTFLIDTADQAIIDLDVSAKWLNDAKIGPKISLQNTGSLESLAADKGV